MSGILVAIKFQCHWTTWVRRWSWNGKSRAIGTAIETWTTCLEKICERIKNEHQQQWEWEWDEDNEAWAVVRNSAMEVRENALVLHKYVAINQRHKLEIPNLDVIERHPVSDRRIPRRIMFVSMEIISSVWIDGRAQVN